MSVREDWEFDADFGWESPRASDWAYRSRPVMNPADPAPRWSAFNREDRTWGMWMSSGREGGASSGAPFESGERLSGHRVLSEVGRGAMGAVWLAEDERLGRKVAIKILDARFHHHDQVRTRFMQEARALARLSHPNVVHIYGLGQPHEPPHFVMEYLEGAPLTEAGQALPLRQKVQLMHKVVMAVDFLHQHHLVHRDLKPGNILVGPDLEPKLLDFGLARELDRHGKRLTDSGEMLGTPHYFSPEHTRTDTPVDARSDIFSLGTILYELLTGNLPFQGEDLREQVSKIREEDPVLPRRLNPQVPGDLQKICLKALEKEPAERYSSAREMASDLERWLAGEPVVAVPSSYSRMIAGKIEQHQRDLEAWRQDRILSDYEYDALRKGYERLFEREDAWIMEVRRLSFSQVCLYLGAWIMVMGAALIFLFRYQALSGMQSVLVLNLALALTGYAGMRAWRREQQRTALAYLLAFCLLVPLTLALALNVGGLAAGFTQGREDLEFFLKAGFHPTTNAQMWWAILLSLPVYLWLRRATRASVFSLVFAIFLALLSLVSLLRLGMLEWLEDEPGRLWVRLLPIALLFFVLAVLLERKHHHTDSRYFYPLAVGFTFAGLSGVAAQHEPIQDVLKSMAPWTNGSREYLFLLNAGAYSLLQAICERFSTAQLRTVAKSFRFVIPGHVMTALLILGLDATEQWNAVRDNPAVNDAVLVWQRMWRARVFEAGLPVVAALFVLASVPKQMKNFLAHGLLFLAIGIVRLEQNWLKDESLWPIGLILGGSLVMACAIHYPGVRAVLWTPLRLHRGRAWIRKLRAQLIPPP